MNYAKEMKRKESRKKVRTILEVIVVIITVYALFLAFFREPVYKPYLDELNSGENSVVGTPQDDKGFITVSYFGVDRNGTDTLISEYNLDKHLKALKSSGYVTITQEDIIAYYKEGKKLPNKSLFLMVEDGRTDSAIFTQPLLEKYNFIATITSYGENFESKDSKFFTGRQLQAMLDTSFWEAGTNGYRLHFINTFDRYERFIGELNPDEFNIMRPYIAREYNHYLMDYIRDEYDIPIEGYEELTERIENDYTLLKTSYLEHMGAVPKLHVLMHSNTGQFGTNDDASSINEECIITDFTINFNREGDSLNEREDSIYDLSRIQPQAHWSTNHLLMRIQDDTKEAMHFEMGDVERKADWNQINGVSEFNEDEIILTSTPKGLGTLMLEKQIDKNLGVSVVLEGNKLGTQRIYVRSNEAKDTAIVIELTNNVLSVIEYMDQKKKELYTQNLDEFDEISYQSIQENKIEADKKKIEVYKKRGIEVEPLESYEDKDMHDYVPMIELKDQSSRKLDIQIENDQLSIYVDDRLFVKEISCIPDGRKLFLECEPNLDDYSQRNLTDDVYDGVFQKLNVTTNNEEVILDYRMKGIDKLIATLKNSFNTIISWFVEVF